MQISITYLLFNLKLISNSYLLNRHIHGTFRMRILKSTRITAGSPNEYQLIRSDLQTCDRYLFHLHFSYRHLLPKQILLYSTHFLLLNQSHLIFRFLLLDYTAYISRKRITRPFKSVKRPPPVGTCLIKSFSWHK